ncbi:nudix hydrolase 26, chloroplastic-like [Impatiens glandulifera]|uniref:nudix hydrolase 26, chloroplastic-like n=1 Tax=Impatiens glandulifera TaxID=253017 RepID=UPI001FB07AAE|nr:nudix hydrolase 26, chloroplastic-like [Impatiens glandulifera]
MDTTSVCRISSAISSPITDKKLICPLSQSSVFSSYKQINLTGIMILQNQQQSARVISCLNPLSSSSSSWPEPLMISLDNPPEGYRRNVGICLINDSKKIFAASRLDIANTWQMPQGGIGNNEDPRVAAIRELKEETGITSAQLLAEVPYCLAYEFSPEARERHKRLYGSNWKGQVQKWFLFEFTGKEEEINLGGDGNEKPEFEEWSWMSSQQIVDLAVDFKKPIYKEVLAVFSTYLQ